ncbi:hypothetical protein BDN67DRAFT_831207 [Paxillus ammoniavirescens]|nr:hypothetical protein BDN67DRAFT_831207 [Paxillus ammoniavirescens]
MEREAKTKMAQPIMSSLCTQHPSTTFISLALERYNGENTSGIPKHAVTPPPSSRWTLAMSGMSIHGNDHTLKSDVEGMQRARPSPSSTVGRVRRMSRVTPSMVFTG